MTMNQDQTVYFWNNYSDTEGANFLAGDILMDNVIDLYDLNAQCPTLARPICRMDGKTMHSTI